MVGLPPGGGAPETGSGSGQQLCLSPHLRVQVAELLQWQHAAQDSLRANEGETAALKEELREVQVRTSLSKLRIVALGFGTARQKMGLERCTTPTLSRCTCSPRYGLQPCQR